MSINNDVPDFLSRGTYPQGEDLTIHFKRPVKAQELANAVLTFIAYLDKTELSDVSEREFHPNYISSCRALDGEQMSVLLSRMKRIAAELQQD